MHVDLSSSANCAALLRDAAARDAGAKGVGVGQGLA